MGYIQYDKKEHNTTVGMPDLAAAESIDGEQESSDDDKIELSEDMYAFIVVCSPKNISFLIALYVIFLKFVLYAILYSGIYLDNGSSMYNSERIVQAVKFFLIPVAVSMQEDLIHVYENLANLKYDKAVLEVSRDATKSKWIIGCILRFIDGFLSLGVNFYVMLSTDDVLSVFLNFAALHFLQGIDDVFFDLVKKGFCGDVMENMTDVCGQVKFPRRVSSHGCVREIDSILWGLTLSICLTVYGVATYRTSVVTWQS